MFPYVEQPILRVGPITFQAFGILVAAAILLGYWMLIRRAEKLGFNADIASRLAIWLVACGLLGAHLFAVTLSDPKDIFSDPLVLLRLWEGLSSFGGFLGGILGGIWFMWNYSLRYAEAWKYFDLVAFVFPFAWILGRAGCFLAHDHPGVETAGWWAVRYPDGQRFDLGLLELLYTLILVGIFLVLDRRQRPTGFYFALFFFLYGPGRFFMDELRINEVKYFGFTLAQHGAVVGALFGGSVLLRIYIISRRKKCPRLG